MKQSTPVLAVLGNPPYNGRAGKAFGDSLVVEEENALSEAYRKTSYVKKPEGPGLNDLYVRFFRMAERRITEMTDRGVVCYISNYSCDRMRSGGLPGPLEGQADVTYALGISPRHNEAPCMCASSVSTAERHSITEMTDRGVVCYISNYSLLMAGYQRIAISPQQGQQVDAPYHSFTGMREHYLEAFDVIRIDNLNGDKYKIGQGQDHARW